jgi:hypothetical protein
VRLLLSTPEKALTYRDSRHGCRQTHCIAVVAIASLAAPVGAITREVSIIATRRDENSHSPPVSAAAPASTTPPFTVNGTGSEEDSSRY